MSSKLQLQIIGENSLIPLGFTESYHALCSIKAPDTIEKDQTSISIVAVIDKSGSMDGLKMDLVKKTCRFLIDQLSSRDHFSLVTYNANVKNDIPLCQMTTENKKRAHKCLDSVFADGSTNLSGGLLSGLQQLFKHQDSGTILLFTDGQANCGITKVDDIVEAVQKVRSSMKKPAQVFTFGFGADHSETLLQGIASKTDGMYYFVENEDSIPTAFADCLGGLMSVAAQNVSISLEPLNGARIIKNLGVLKQRRESKAPSPETCEENIEDEEITVEDTRTDGKSPSTKRKRAAPKSKRPVKKAKSSDPELGSTDTLVVDLGDIYCEENRDVVYVLSVPSVAKETTQELVKATLNYFEISSSSFQTIETTFSLSRSGEVTSFTRDLQIDVQLNRLLTVDAISKAQQSSGDTQKASEILSDALKKIQTSPSSSDPLCLQFIQDLKELIDDLKDATSVHITSKKMVSKAASHSAQRSVGGSAYATNSKGAVKRKMQHFVKAFEDEDQDEEQDSDFNDDMDMDVEEVHPKGKGSTKRHRLPVQQKPKQVQQQQQQQKQQSDRTPVRRGKGGKGLGKSQCY